MTDLGTIERLLSEAASARLIARSDLDVADLALRSASERRADASAAHDAAVALVDTLRR
jgi:hypothetical protein